VSTSAASQEWYERALAAYRAGEYARCRDLAQEALATDPRNVPCLILKGMGLIELGQAKNAVEPLQQAISIAPENADAWRQLGIAVLMAGDRTAALHAFQKTQGLRPEEVPVLVDVGNLLFTVERPQEALETLEEARRLKPGDLTILRNLADMYASLERYEQALRTTNEILELRPDDVLVCCDAASLCLRLDRWDEAANVFRTLRRIDQEHEVYAIHGLVMTEIRRRDWRQAVDFIIEATRLDRYDLTTSFLVYVTGKFFGRSAVAEISLNELVARFEAEQRDHRRLHAEIQS
jgi:tetratricopeptide (TPR) repeat protein